MENTHRNNSDNYGNGDNSSLLVSRRSFLYGAAAIGAGAIGAASLAAAGCTAGSNDDVDYLTVPQSALVTQNDFEVVENPADRVQLSGQYELPYGTLVWANDEDVAACLLPTDSGSPLTQVGLLWFGSGTLATVIKSAVGSLENFEIYDVRATSSGLVWTEASILKGTWRIYTARIANGELNGDPVMVEEGDSSYETPTIAAVGGKAFWQVLPKQPNDSGLPSRLMSASFGEQSTNRILENARRMGTPLYAGTDSVTVTPRLDRASTYYQLTNIDASSGSTLDTLTLPGGMSPLEAGYGERGFMFSFSNIYNYGEGISNLGTYTPLAKPSNGNYSNVRWFGFARTPTAAPAWCNGLLIVKSSYSVCGIDLDAQTYFVLDVDDGADDYGEYLASSGAHSTFVTYSNIDHQPIGKPAIHACRVKRWTTVQQA